MVKVSNKIVTQYAMHIRNACHSFSGVTRAPNIWCGFTQLIILVCHALCKTSCNPVCVVNSLRNVTTSIKRMNILAVPHLQKSIALSKVST